MSAVSPSIAPFRFSELGVPQSLWAVLEQQGITTTFPIQAATLPDCLAGLDVCAQAPTGAGKTLAFGLAMLSRMSADPGGKRRGRRHPSALVLVPTRELAAQIEGVIRPLGEAIGARVAAIYGGVGYGGQLAALGKGVDVLIACPGRMTDLVERRAVELSYVNTVVVDEADRMADMGFLPAVRRLIDRTSAKRQTLLFSATLDGPVERLIRDYQHHPVRHSVEPTDLDRGTVFHHFWRVDSHKRISVTADAVTACGPAVVFCRTKRGADRLSDRLARSGLATAAIHGNRSQSQRERALTAFRGGRLDVLVATDIAARGIHVDGVPLVVHFDPPADATDYIHRSGRTGRAGENGTVVSLIDREHLATATLIQRRLGLPTGLSQPDVRSLAVSHDDRLFPSQLARAEPAKGGRHKTGHPQNPKGAATPRHLSGRRRRMARRR